MEYKKRALRITSDITFIALLVLLIIYCISLLVPIAWMLINSFKELPDYLLHPFQFPEKFTLEPYREVFQVLKADFITKSGARVTYGLFPMAVYSVLYTFGYSFFYVFVTSVVSYVLSRYKFPGRNFIYTLGIIVMIVPIVGSLPSAMYIYRRLGIYNSMIALILVSPSTAFSGTYFLLLYAAFKNIPATYSEAAFIDGAGHFTVMLRLIFPMVVPSMVAVFVLIFLGAWNDYNTFLVWLPSYPSLSVGLYLFEQGTTKSGAVGMPTILASFIIVIIPTVLLYLGTQGILMSKLTVGGLKG